MSNAVLSPEKKGDTATITSPPEYSVEKNSELKSLLSFFAKSSIYCVTVALIIGFVLIGSLILLSN